MMKPLDDMTRSVTLPPSKSEANRALMVHHYAGLPLPSFAGAAADVVLLRELLDKIRNHDGEDMLTLDCCNAGTVLRFLTTALSMRKGRYVLTGNERMRKRPIEELVDALASLGASINYLDDKGYPPIMIEGHDIDGGTVEISAMRSSQYVTSLLLAAPLMKNGLSLRLVGQTTSQPYIDMTIKMMRDYGIKVKYDDDVIRIDPQHYSCRSVKIAADWSSAAFWYEMVALCNDEMMLMENLDVDTEQADAAAAEIFENLGVTTCQTDNGVLLKKNNVISDEINVDFTHRPDLFPAVIATCAALKVKATMTGLRNLSIKESDRKHAMMTELSKLNVCFENVEDDSMTMMPTLTLPSFDRQNPLTVGHYDDHRITMSLAVLSHAIGTVKIADKDTVKKSYPGFWDDFGTLLNCL